MEKERDRASERCVSRDAFSLRSLLILIGVIGVCLIPIRSCIHVRTHVRQATELERAFRAHGWEHGYAARWYDEGVEITDSQFGDTQLLVIKQSLEKSRRRGFCLLKAHK